MQGVFGQDPIHRQRTGSRFRDRGPLVQRVHPVRRTRSSSVAAPHAGLRPRFAPDRPRCGAIPRQSTR